MCGGVGARVCVCARLYVCVRVRACKEERDSLSAPVHLEYRLIAPPLGKPLDSATHCNTV